MVRRRSAHGAGLEGGRAALLLLAMMCLPQPRCASAGASARRDDSVATRSAGVGPACDANLIAWPSVQCTVPCPASPDCVSQSDVTTVLFLCFVLPLPLPMRRCSRWKESSPSLALTTLASPAGSWRSTAACTAADACVWVAGRRAGYALQVLSLALGLRASATIPYLSRRAERVSPGHSLSARMAQST